MADIFISYSQADRSKVAMLAAYLESEGWTVWYDKNLTPGDPYRDEIMKQLATARAVIVLWTQNSIKSDFVRAEAGQAKAQSKLIPVKESDVAYDDIPLPFGEMHTEESSKRELIRSAIVAQLAKPQIQPSGWRLSTKTLRYQALTWLGITGGAITLFSNLQGVLNLADWAHWVITHWREYTSAFWLWTFGWVGIKLPNGLVPLLSLGMFCLATAIGARRFSTQVSPNEKHELKNFVNLWVLTALVPIGQILLMVAFVLASIFLRTDLSYTEWPILNVLGPVVQILILFRALYKSRTRSYFVLFIVVFGILYSIIYGDSGGLGLVGAAQTFIDSIGDNTIRLVAEFLAYFLLLPFMVSLTYLLPIVMLRICPLKPLTQRLVFLVLGVGILIGLNEVSKYAPGIRELLKPPA
jgi:hypothetical protein